MATSKTTRLSSNREFGKSGKRILDFFACCNIKMINMKFWKPVAITKSVFFLLAAVLKNNGAAQIKLKDVMLLLHLRAHAPLARATFLHLKHAPTPLD